MFNISNHQKSSKEFSPIIISREKIRRTIKQFIEKSDYTQEITSAQDKETLAYIFWEILFLEEDSNKICTNLQEDFYFVDLQKSFYNVIVLTHLLSHREKSWDKEKGKIKQQYEKFEKSFWQDLGYLNITNPNLKTTKFISQTLGQEKIVALAKELLPAFKEIFSAELDAIATPSKENDLNRGKVRKKYLEPYEKPNSVHPLKNLHAISNYYRDIENLEKIKKYTAPSLLKELNFNSSADRYAFLRIMVIVGECCSQKNISIETKYLGYKKIDWHAFILLRDALVHAGEEGYSNVLQNLNIISNVEQYENLKKELEALHENITKILSQLKNHKNKEKELEQILNLYKWKINEESQKKILEFFKSPISTNSATVYELNKKIDQLLAGDIREHEPLMQNIKKLIFDDKEIKQEKKNEFLQKIFKLLKNNLKNFEKDMHALLNNKDKKNNKTEVEKFFDNITNGASTASTNKTVPELALDAIASLESVLSNEIKEILEQQKTPFPDCKYFVKNDQANISVPSDLVKKNLSSGDVYSGEIKQIDDDDKKKIISEWIKNNQKEVEKSSFEENRFSKIIDELKKNPSLYLALDYLIAKIFPYIEKLTKEQKNFLKEELGELWEAELKLQRNSEQHFNIPEDVCSTGREEFLVRYISLYVLKIKTKLEEIKNEEKKQKKINFTSNVNRFLFSENSKNQENTINQNKNYSNMLLNKK